MRAAAIEFRMKQIELLPKRAKAKFCNWITFYPVRVCGAKAVIEIRHGAYCEKHAQAASLMFGQGKPIYAMDATGV